MKRLLILALSSFSISAPSITSAHAQLGGQLSVGLFGVSGNSVFDGGRQLSVFPYIEYQDGPWTFGGQNLVTFGWGDTNAGLNGIVGLGYDLGQDEASAPAVSATTTVLGTVAFRHPFFEVAADLEEHLGGSNGRTVELSATSGLPLNQDMFLSISYSIKQGSDNYREAFYNVSGFGNVEDTFSLLNIWQIDPISTVFIGLDRSTLANEIADKAFIEDAKSTTLLFGYIRNL